MSQLTQPDCLHCKARTNSIFGELNFENVNELNTVKFCKTYRKGQTIFEEGAFPQGLHCVNNGKVKVIQDGADGREQIIHLAKGGDVIGHRALLGGDTYSGTAVAIEDSSLCFIPAKAFINMVEHNAKLAFRIIHLFSDELKAADKNITDLAQKTVKERLAQSILMLNKSYGVKEDKKTLNITISRNELAGIVGTARETVTRALLELNKDNIVGLKGKDIQILDRERLIATANLFD
jgi:CRP-like cAMP-binding protein